MVIRVVIVFVSCLLFLDLRTHAQEQNYPYHLNKTDYFTVPVAAITYGASLYLQQPQDKLTVDQVLVLNASTINNFDRSATQHWNESLNNLSDVGKYTLFAVPCILVVPPLLNKDYKSATTYSCMYFETLLVNLALTELSKNIVQRKRPALYNSDLSIEQKMDLIDEDGGNDSFFSGHASLAFSSAVFLSKTVTDIYGKGSLSTLVWVSSLSLASVTGYLRYASGQHFPTDIIAGAAVGSLVGYLIPVMHKKSHSGLSFYALPYGMGFCYSL